MNDEPDAIQTADYPRPELAAGSRVPRLRFENISFLYTTVYVAIAVLAINAPHPWHNHFNVLLPGASLAPVLAVGALFFAWRASDASRGRRLRLAVLNLVAALLVTVMYPVFI